MRTLIAPDSFKGSLSAIEAAERMAKGIARIFPDAEYDLAPIADGGEGTVDALVTATNGTCRTITASGPLGAPVQARWGMLGNGTTAVVEMAAASGLTLVDLDARDPLRADTYGTGELIAAALEALHADCTSKTSSTRPMLLIGIGGSATNDGGTGALRALGVRFLDASGNELPPGGAALARLDSIDHSAIHPLLAATDIRVACDVDTPLLGERGASAVFGPQKGATPDMVRELDAALGRFAAIAEQVTGKDCAAVAGAGAAGGLGAGLLFFTNATLAPGISIVLDAIGFADRARKADIVFTGEGSSDIQTAYGKAPAGVAAISKRYGKPVICISGALGKGVEAVYEQGIDGIMSAVRSIIPLEESMENAGEMLEDAAERTCRLLRVGMGMREDGVN